MKISHLVWAIIALGFMVLGIKVSLEQQKVLNLLVATHGGHDQSATGSGLRQLREELTSEANKIAGERAKTVETSEKNRMTMRNARDQRDESSATLATRKDELAAAKEQLAEETARVDQLTNELKSSLAQLKEGLGDTNLNIDDSAGTKEIVYAISTYVEEVTADIARMKSELEEQQTLVDASTSRVASSTVDLDNVEEINDNFFNVYSRNDESYHVVAVNDRWNMVIFDAPASSGLIPGDEVPLVVMRGEQAIAPIEIVSVKGNSVVAEFDPANLHKGLTIMPGDTIIRVKPADTGTVERALRDYARHDKEFIVRAVNNNTNVIVFNAHTSSPLAAGDEISVKLARHGNKQLPLVIIDSKDGNVVAEIVEDQRPAGFDVRIGDRLTTN